MTLTRALRLPNLERWYMYPGSVYSGKPEYQDTYLEVFIWESDEIYILTITDVPEDSLYRNEELIADIESLAHHLVFEKGSTQLYECYTIDMSDFVYDRDSEGNRAIQLMEYRDEKRMDYVEKYIYPKYPLKGLNHHQTTFQY